MLSIRCKRVGRKNLPHYKIIVIEKSRSNSSKYIENLGWYKPSLNDKPLECKINKDRLDYWVSKGAQCSVRVNYLLRKK